MSCFRFPVFCALMMVTLLLPAQNHVPDYPEPWVVRAWYPTREAGLATAAEFGPWEVNHKDGYLVLEVNADRWQDLNNQGFILEFDEANTRQLQFRARSLPGQDMGIPGFPCYRTVEETHATMQGLVNSYPQLAQLVDAGDSWEKTQNSQNGYDMLVLVLTNTAISGPKPKFIMTSAIHAREYTTAEMATRFAEHLLANYNVDPDITWLLDDQEIHLLLQTNPDGRKRAETGSSWRKNTDNDFCSNSSSRGVDLNRNFEFLWNCCAGSSGTPCSDTYRGPSPVSEPEPQAVVAYLRSQFPDQRPDDPNIAAPLDATGIYMDLHSYSELVLWPWGYTDTPPPNPGLATLGRKLAWFNGYSPEQASELYITDGTTDDFAYGDLGVAAYTFELGTSFFQSCSVFEDRIFPDNLPALIYMARLARTPYLTAPGPDVITLNVLTAAVAPGEPLVVNALLDDGRYNQSNGVEPVQNITAGTCYIDVPPWKPDATAVTMSASDGSFDSALEATTATLPTTGLADGRHTLYVRGRDADGNWGPVSALFFYILDPKTAPRIEGFVTDAATGDPVTATLSTGVFSAESEAGTGFYSLMTPPGTYNLTATADGFESQTLTGLDVQATIRQDFSLIPYCSIFEDTVEGPNPGWDAAAPWAITDQQAASGTFSWTDSPAGNYVNNVDTALTSPVFDFSDFQNPTLTFDHRYDTESGFDYCRVAYRIGAGAWVELARYDGNQTQWQEEHFALNALAGQSEVQFRFRLTSDTSQTRDGWYLDNIRIGAASLACGNAPTLAELLEQWPTVDILRLVQAANVL